MRHTGQNSVTKSGKKGGQQAIILCSALDHGLMVMAAPSGNIWLPTIIPQNFSTRPFPCGFCVLQEQEKKRCSVVEDLPPVMEADSTEQYGVKVNMRTFGVDEDPGEDVVAKVVTVAE